MAYYNINEFRKFATVTGSKLSDVVIPDSISDENGKYKVTKIDNVAFRKGNIISVTIPNSVTSIGDSTFYGCSALTSAIINCEIIGDYAFDDCRNLLSLTLGDETTSIGKCAFRRCNIASLRTGDGVTTIGLSAFANCTGLTSLEIGDNVTSIKSAAFFNCKSLSSIVVKDGNQVYDSRNNCNAIILTKENELVLGCENTVIPDEMTSIGEYAFDGCVNLSSISIPNGVTNIGYDAFGGCSGLSSITLPDHLVSIGDLAFGDCTGLKSIIIPQNVEFIGFGAFSGCTALTSVTISSNVKEIGDGIFIDCDALTSIVVEEGNGTYDSRNNCNAIIHSETGELIAGCQNTVIPDGVKSIRGFAFEFLDGLSSITIPDGVTSIGEYAFYDCEGLTSVDLPNSLTTIGEGAFQRCIGLSAIKIPHGVTYIGEFAFDSCSGVTSVIIPNSVTFIGWDAFLDCTELKDVYCEAEQLSETEDGPGLFAEIQVFGLLWNELPITLHVPEASLDLYSTMDPWKYFKTIVSLTDDDPKSTGIKSLTDDGSNYPVGTYSIDGKRLQKVQRGLNIIRMKDGKTIKRIVK